MVTQTSQTHINLNDINYITFTPRKQLNYRWYEHAPPVKKFFGLGTKRKELEAGWCDKGGFSVYYLIGCGWIGGRDTTEQLLRDGTRVYVDLYADGIQWFKKAKVCVSKRKSYHTQYFDTDKEALAWVESIKEKSGDKFEVLINK